MQYQTQLHIHLHATPSASDIGIFAQEFDIYFYSKAKNDKDLLCHDEYISVPISLNGIYLTVI